MVKTYKDVVVGIPTDAHISFSTKRVYVITQKNYRRDKGYNQDSRKVIGTCINSTEMHPNANFKELYPALWAELTKTKSLPSTKKIGMKAAVSSIVEREGLGKELKAVFGEESSNAILDYVMYAIESISDVTEEMTNHFLFSDKIYDENWYRDFFNKGINPADCTKFKDDWAKHCKELGYEEVYLCFDGYIHAVTATDTMPVTFAEYRDSEEITAIITYLKAFGFKIKGAIIDPYFCRKEILDFLESQGIEYVVLLTDNTTGRTTMMSKYAENLKWNVKYFIRTAEIFGITDKAPIFQNSEHYSFIHLFFDWKNGGERAIKLIGETYAAMTGSISVKKSDALQKAIDNTGFYAIATSKEMTAAEAYLKYKSKKNSEECYKFVKEHLGFKELSKIFFWFLVSIIRNYILKACKECKISSSQALQEITLLEARLLPDDNYVFIHNENSRQKALMSKIGITDSLISEIIAEENNLNHGVIERRRKRKPGPKKGSHNNKYDESGNIIPRKPGPKPGSHHKTVKLKKDGTPKQKPGPKPGSKHKI